MPTSPAGKSLPFDPSLLQPIVRSKRTPIACTECRRRQVKCSGTMPRCERCTNKNIECTYVPLSEQRSSSTSGNPLSWQSQQALNPSQAGHPHPQGHAYSGGALARASTPMRSSTPGWQAGVQGYTAGSAYPPPQGWQASQSIPSAMGAQTQQGSANQSYTGVPMAYAQNYNQTAYVQGSGGGQTGDAVPQGYVQQGGETYNAYGHVVPEGDPRYAYQAAQMAAMSSEGQQSSAAYMQYAQEQQMYFDPVSGQMIPFDVAGQWVDPNAAYQITNYPGTN